MPTQLSPMKSRRLDEKTSLQSLNSRLEQYVLRVKETEDAKVMAEKELMSIRDRMESEMEQIKGALQNELQTTRKKLDEEMDNRARLQVLEQEQHTELVKLREQVKELGEAKALAEKLGSQLEKEKADARSSKEKLSTQGTELAVAQRQLKELEREIRSLQASLGDTNRELEHYKKKSADVDGSRESELATMRKSLIQAHQEEMSQLKKDQVQREKSIEQEVRNYFDSIVQNNKNKIEELEMDLSATKKELEQTGSKLDEALQEKTTQSARIAELEREYREDRRKFKEDRKAYETNLEKLRVARMTLEQDFNDLMDVKIALDAEITAYRRILDREETRVGLPTPHSTPKGRGNKRKNEAGGNGKASKRAKRSAGNQENLSNIRIVELDLAKDRIAIENTGSKSITLGNWEVRGRAENQVFRIPDAYVLKPHSKMVVYSTKRVKAPKDANKKKGEDVFLSRKFSLDPAGDFVVLFSDDRQVVCTKAEGLPADEVQALEEELAFEEGDDEAAPSDGCGVM